MVDISYVPVEALVMILLFFLFVAVFGEIVRKKVIKKARVEYILFDLSLRDIELVKFEPLRFNSGDFRVSWFYMLYPQLRSGIFKNTDYIKLLLKKGTKTVSVTVRIESIGFINIDNVIYSRNLDEI